jgi:adenine phosphoribosyltransferase
VRDVLHAAHDPRPAPRPRPHHPGPPKPGILFRDVTTLLLHAEGFAAAIDQLAATVPHKPDLVAGIEARGFITATALALKLGAGLLLIRKDGKLPGETIAEDYALEYGTDRLTMHVDACTPAPGSSSPTTSSPPAAPRSPPPG